MPSKSLLFLFKFSQFFLHAWRQFRTEILPALKQNARHHPRLPVEPVMFLGRRRQLLRLKQNLCRPRQHCDITKQLVRDFHITFFDDCFTHYIRGEVCQTPDSLTNPLKVSLYRN